MKTLQDVKQEIVEDLDRDDLSDQIDRELLAALKYYKDKEAFHFSDDAKWPEEAFELLRGRAGRKICAFKIQDFEMMQVYERLEQDSLTHLRQLKEQQSPSHILQGSGL